MLSTKPMLITCSRGNLLGLDHSANECILNGSSLRAHSNSITIRGQTVQCRCLAMVTAASIIQMVAERAVTDVAVTCTALAAAARVTAIIFNVNLVVGGRRFVIVTSRTRTARVPIERTLWLGTFLQIDGLTDGLPRVVVLWWAVLMGELVQHGSQRETVAGNSAQLVGVLLGRQQGEWVETPVSRCLHRWLRQDVRYHVSRRQLGHRTTVHITFARLGCTGRWDDSCNLIVELANKVGQLLHGRTTMDYRQWSSVASDPMNGVWLSNSGTEWPCANVRNVARLYSGGSVPWFTLVLDSPPPDWFDWSTIGVVG